MKAVVIYNSKTGYTKQYAEWIAEEVQCDIFEGKNFKADDLEKYDTIIFGGGIYVGAINKLRFIKCNMDKMIGKRVIVFATGMGSESEEYEKTIRDKNFDETEKSKIKFFYFRGGLNYSSLGLLDKCLLSGMKIMIKKKKPEERSEDEKTVLESFDKPVSFLEKSKIKPLLNYI